MLFSILIFKANEFVTDILRPFLQVSVKRFQRCRSVIDSLKLKWNQLANPRLDARLAMLDVCALNQSLWENEADLLQWKKRQYSAIFNQIASSENQNVFFIT